MFWCFGVFLFHVCFQCSMDVLNSLFYRLKNILIFISLYLYSFHVILCQYWTAGCVQVLIGELEDCAENQSATNVAAECLNALDCIAIVSQGTERKMNTVWEDLFSLVLTCSPSSCSSCSSPLLPPPLP